MSESSKHIRLGSFVIAGTVLLVLALYFIGNKQNVFGNRFRIIANFRNVSGLMKGNNVRLGGIDIGTVDEVNILNDTSVRVVMVIDESVRKHVKRNSIASIGTDGLMGNRLVNINNESAYSESVSEGDELRTRRPIEMDEMMRTLNSTNENMQVISSNLRNVSDKLNAKSSLWTLFTDSVLAENIKGTVVNLRLIGEKGVMITGDISQITGHMKKGKGSLGALITDTTFSSNLSQTIVKFEKLSDTVAIISNDVSRIVAGLKSGKGSVGVLLNDTSVIHNLNQSLNNISKGAASLDENMNALKHTWPFKKYFKKQKIKK